MHQEGQLVKFNLDRAQTFWLPVVSCPSVQTELLGRSSWLGTAKHLTMMGGRLRRPQEEGFRKRENAPSAIHPSPTTPHPCHSPLTCDVRPVIYEKVGRDHSLVSGQHNLLQKVRAKVFLHPGILKVTEEMTVSDGTERWLSLGPQHWERRRQISVASSVLRNLTFGSRVPAHLSPPLQKGHNSDQELTSPELHRLLCSQCSNKVCHAGCH